jgi:hypothetical protein
VRSNYNLYVWEHSGKYFYTPLGIKPVLYGWWAGATRLYMVRVKLKAKQ